MRAPRNRAETRRTRRLQVERLEDRRLLAATDLASITGTVFRDLTGNGQDPGEEVAGATVNLYRDDGNGTFDIGADTLVTTTTTNANGVYQFDRLTAATYFVHQPAQTVGARTLNATTSNAITFSATDVMGARGLPIDTFDTTAQRVQASSTGTNPDSSSLDTAANEAIGNERDMVATLTGGAGAITLEAMAFGLPILQFDSTANVAGTRVVTWDGDDNDANTLNATGLGGIDLTQASLADHIEFTIGADQNGGTVQLTLFTDATNFSTASAAIPNTGGAATGTVLIPFTGFATGTGAAGPATITNIGAVQMNIEATAQSVNGRLDLVGTVGPTVRTQNFANVQTADLAVTKTVDNASPNVGDNVIFTVTLLNQGPDTATNVTVGDVLPAGLTFVSATPSQGGYVNGTGVWTVGTVANGATANLMLTATVANSGTKTNTAQVTATEQVDNDSTPNNNVAAEDDQDDAVVTPQVADLSVTKIVSNAIPDPGDTVQFTVTLANAGPSTATNVTLNDLLPAGLTFVSATPSQGNYVSGTGVWTVGTVNSGAMANLLINATVATPGTKTNTAQVGTADQFDPDSTPNNNVAAEDDQAEVLITPRARISGFVYADTNNNGVMDAGEIGIANASLTLTGTDTNGAAVTQTVTTAANGSYLFSIAPSNAAGYTINETQPTTHLDGRDTAGSQGGTVAAPSSVDRISQIVVGSGVSATDYNFGELLPASLGGNVYIDTNQNGTLDAGEVGIAGVSVTLTGTDDLGAAVNQTIMTAADGSYLFGNLRPSDGNGYSTRETQPIGFLDGQESAGTPVNATVADDVFSTMVLTSGVDGRNYNFAEIVNIVSKRRFLASTR